MSLTLDAMAFARAEVEKLMVDTWTFRRPVDKRDWPIDPDTDKPIPPPGGPPVVYNGKGLFGTDARKPLEASQGGEELSIPSRHVALPAATEGIKVGDVGECTASRDPELVGAFVTVTAVSEGTHRLTRRLSVSDPTRKPPWP